MTAQTPGTPARTSYRSTGWAGILSGVLGIVAFALLFTAVMSRSEMAISRPIYPLFRAHDVAVILQFLLLVPIVLAFQKLSDGMSRLMFFIGIGALLFAVVLLLLGTAGMIADLLYTVPQGIFGAWLVFVCWNTRGAISRGLRWFGVVVGFGLILVGTFPIGYSIFVNTLILQIPAVDPANYPEPDENAANQILHFILLIGSFMGVITLPIWTFLLGRRLLRKQTS